MSNLGLGLYSHLLSTQQPVSAPVLPSTVESFSNEAIDTLIYGFTSHVSSCALMIQSEYLCDNFTVIGLFL